MMWYKACEFCKVEGERRKSLPFGNEDGSVLFVLPNYLALDLGAQKEYCNAYPQAFFVSFAACGNVEDRENAELMCSILLRNTARKFYRVLISDYAPLKKLFGVEGDSTTKEDGTQIAVYRGMPDGNSAKEEYKRITHA